MPGWGAASRLDCVAYCEPGLLIDAAFAGSSFAQNPCHETGEPVGGARRWEGKARWVATNGLDPRRQLSLFDHAFSISSVETAASMRSK
jgi:hypothetical protein